MSSDAPPPKILCDDWQVPVTPNCYSALLRLRQQHDKLTISVEALCIDQKNGHEKSMQIPLMGEIYSKAKVSYMWLGEGTDETDRVMSRLGM